MRITFLRFIKHSARRRAPSFRYALLESSGYRYTNVRRCPLGFRQRLVSRPPEGRSRPGLCLAGTVPTPTERVVDVNGVRLRVVEAGPPDGPVVVLAHGFPELAYSWRHQMPALAAAGYHVLAPDQRGYGGSSRPAGSRPTTSPR